GAEARHRREREDHARPEDNGEPEGERGALRRRHLSRHGRIVGTPATAATLGQSQASSGSTVCLAARPRRAPTGIASPRPVPSSTPNTAPTIRPLASSTGPASPSCTAELSRNTFVLAPNGAPATLSTTTPGSSRSLPSRSVTTTTDAPASTLEPDPRIRGSRRATWTTPSSPRRYAV